MNQHLNQSYPVSVYYRLIALWATCEAFAGGIMHAAKVPFTGMIISSLAIICISLIAWHFPSKGFRIKGNDHCSNFKLMLSPFSTYRIHIAVFFQGLMGQLLLSNKNIFVLQQYCWRACACWICCSTHSCTGHHLRQSVLACHWWIHQENNRAKTGYTIQFHAGCWLYNLTRHRGYFHRLCCSQDRYRIEPMGNKIPRTTDRTQTNKTKIEAVAKIRIDSK